MISLRPYQVDVKNDIHSLWTEGSSYVLAVLPTGAGKTVTFSDIIKDHNGSSCAIAHRQELVSQISMALARDGVKHRIIGPKSVVKLCVSLHMEELGVSYYYPNASCAVAGVDTLVRRKNELGSWFKSVTLWVTDEAHHLLTENKWGLSVSLFPNAKGLGVTATPMRADGKGLGAHADGVFEDMVIGPNMRDLITMGYLTNYRIFAPPCDLHLTDDDISKRTGDYKPQRLKIATRESKIIGDIVEHYLRIAKGKLGITFASDVETATDIAKRFNEAGVPAAVVSGNTTDRERVAIQRRFKRRELLQLVNVDLFGEGYDLPAIEVVGMARKTASYGLYVQQFGRALRPMKGKEYAIIIDHVGNVERHGLPDMPRKWSLDRRDRRKKSKPDDAIPVKTCLNTKCMAVYERIHKKCPYCGYQNIPVGRSSPEQVDGDLVELDADTLAKMRGEIEKVDMPQGEYRALLQSRHVPEIGQHAHVKRHVVRQEAQAALRDRMAYWGGYQRHLGRDDSEIYRRFYYTFGVDFMTAQALKTDEANKLTERINESLSVGDQMGSVG